MGEVKRGPGRPSKPASERRDLAIAFKVTKAEHDYLFLQAARRGQSIGDFARSLALAGMPGDTAKRSAAE